jgi:hypothetical protein
MYEGPQLQSRLGQKNCEICYACTTLVCRRFISEIFGALQDLIASNVDIKYISSDSESNFRSYARTRRLRSWCFDHSDVDNLYAVHFDKSVSQAIPQLDTLGHSVLQ